MDRLRGCLKKYWGYAGFLPLQEEIIGSVLEGRDTLAVMATGGGKSLCYQVPAVFAGGLTLVVSPLLSLMKDQVDDLNARGIPAAALTGALDYRERARISAGLKDNTFRLLFVSPEKCLQPQFLASLGELQVRLIAIDEAHCISEWGHNFRPEYRQLAQLRKVLPGVPVIALTASATAGVRRDIVLQLGLEAPRVFVGSFNRKNLRYRILEKKNAIVFLLDYIGSHRNGAGIVYCLAKRETEEIAEGLRKRGFPAAAYHAGLSRQERERVQDAFLKDRVSVVCATVAFGMGIDKPDVRYVIHYELPKSIESYYQETGRAGRDGRPGECILLYSRIDAERIRRMLERDQGSTGHLRNGLNRLREMREYCESTACRRRSLLGYFGEEYPEENCGLCDICNHPPALADCTEAARRIAGCIRQLPEPSGAGLVTDILRGVKNDRILRQGFDRLPAFGSGRSSGRAEYRSWTDALVRQGFLARHGGLYPVLSLTARGQELLDGRCRVMLPVPEKHRSGNPRPLPEKTAETGENGLFLRLRTLRRSLADARGVPPFVIFPDKSLREMAAARPCDREQFAAIPGVGAFRLEQYGPAFIEEIRKGSAPAPA